MKLKHILVELTVDQSLKILNLSNDDIGDAQKIKDAFRSASLKAHPDRGGSNEDFRDVKDAFDTLSKASKATTQRFDWAKNDAENRKLSNDIFEQIRNNFKPEVFVKYFKDVYGVPFNYKIIREVKNDTSFAGFTVKFANDDNDIILELIFSVYLVNVKRSSGLGSGVGNISYPLGITANGLFNDKKLKITQRDYTSTQNHDVFINPELTFPKAKLEKNKKTSVTKVFKKQDMIAFLTKKYGMSWDGEYCRKTFDLDEKISIVFRRWTFMRTGAWDCEVSRKGKFVREVPSQSLPENILVAKLFGDIIERAMKLKTADELVSFVASEISKVKENNQKYWV